MRNNLKILSDGTVCQEVSRGGVVLGYVRPSVATPKPAWASIYFEYALEHDQNSYAFWDQSHATKAAAIAALTAEGKP